MGFQQPPPKIGWRRDKSWLTSPQYVCSVCLYDSTPHTLLGEGVIINIRLAF